MTCDLGNGRRGNQPEPYSSSSISGTVCVARGWQSVVPHKGLTPHTPEAGDGRCLQLHQTATRATTRRRCSVTCRKRWITSDRISARLMNLSSRPCLRLPRRSWVGSRRPSATMSRRTRKPGAREWPQGLSHALEIDEMRRRGAVALAAALTMGVVVNLGGLIVPAETATQAVEKRHAAKGIGRKL